MGRAHILLGTRWAAMLALSAALGSCTLFSESGSGVCVNTGVSTYAFTGAWKQVGGYTTPRTDLELETDFNLLMIEPGDRMCQANISNSVSTGANFKALFTNDVNTRTVEVQYDVNDAPAPEAAKTALKYSFTGSCGTTKMALRYPDNHVEQYTLYNTAVDVGACDPSQ